MKEIIKKAAPLCLPSVTREEHIDMLVSYLVANGVMVLPCKIGDKIYQTDGVRIYESTINEITITTKHAIFVTENIAFDESAIGKSVFLSYPNPPKGVE